MKRFLGIALFAGLLFAIAGYTVYSRLLSAPQRAPDTVEAPPSAQETPPPARDEALPGTGDWNTYHGDSALRGVAASEWTPPLCVRWRLKTGGPVRQTPVVCGGRIFAATARGGILCADLDGTLLWSRELQSAASDGTPRRERIDAPIACFDDLLLTGTADGTVYALDADTGETRWQHALDETILGTPNYLADSADEEGQPGSVYVLEQTSGTLVCLDAASGDLRWRAESVDRSDASPSAAKEGIVFGSCAAALHVFDPETGKRLRDIEIDPDSQVAGGVALLEGNVYSGSRSGKVIAADIASGETLWTHEVSESEVFATPAVNDAWVIAAAYDGYVYALEQKTGALRWKFDTAGMPLSPVIAGDTVFVSADGTLFMLRLEDGERLFSLEIADEITAPAVVRGLVLIGSEDGAVAALSSDCGEET